MEIKSIPFQFVNKLTEFNNNIAALQQRREGYLVAIMDSMELEGQWQFDADKMAFMRNTPKTPQADG